MPKADLPKGYEPWDVEKRWIEYWNENRSFTPDAKAPGEPYCIVIPPPNVTGVLHMGHALNMTLQDILCRYHRQIGRKVLWVPGTDHAGIATQNVVERAVAEEGKSRHDLGREGFVERVWEWKEECGGKILNQISRLGASVDWTRLRFTMDEGLSRAVREIFVRLYEDGLIYKGDYIINWCPRCHTALADLEVEYAPKSAFLYHINYPLVDGQGHVTVATVRPETMLGDTAVAVHPEDERYKDLIGKKVRLPLTGRDIPVIADEYVDREFGTGCLKITPAHDMNDFEIGRKHDLPVLRVIGGDGRMTDEAGERYAGLSIAEAREKVVADLTDQGLLEKQEPYDHNVGECYRCKTMVEPYVSKQWFVAVKPLAERARKVVEEGKTTIYPASWTANYYDWLDNIRDWCISRQIWWGHRIPAWTCEACGKLTVSREDPAKCPHCGGPVVQEEDVLDTWFSSGLWPFSTLGWPDDTEDLRTFYPNSVLVTGFDILFFWVARMMMMGLYAMDDVPFYHVYIHALVRDAEGKKMSKSKGNVIDPLLMMDKYGTDALRFTLTAFAAMGRDIKLSEERIEGYRHFINKLWNAARLVLMNLPGEFSPKMPARPKGLHHRWIMHRLEQVKAGTAESIEQYNFNDAAGELYQFVWHEYCDWYLEMIKPDLASDDEGVALAARSLLWDTLREILILLHPIIPFVTQEIWDHLPCTDADDLTRVSFPERKPGYLDEQAETDMKFLQDLVISVRNIRSELGISPSKELTVLVRRGETDLERFFEENRVYVQRLARVGEIRVMPNSDSPPRASASALVMGHEVFVPLAGAVDFEAELARLDKELGKLEKDLSVVGKKLRNDSFIAKAPAEVVAKEKDKEKAMTEKQEKLRNLQDRLKKAMAEA